MPADTPKPAAVPSPCVRNCCLDENDVCLGCHRSLDEICTWASSTDDQKREVLARCKARAEERRREPPPGPAKPW